MDKSLGDLMNHLKKGCGGKYPNPLSATTDRTPLETYGYFSSAPLRGKRTCYEGGLRVPLSPVGKARQSELLFHHAKRECTTSRSEQ